MSRAVREHNDLVAEVERLRVQNASLQMQLNNAKDQLAIAEIRYETAVDLFLRTQKAISNNEEKE